MRVQRAVPEGSVGDTILLDPVRQVFWEIAKCNILYGYNFNDLTGIAHKKVQNQGNTPDKAPQIELPHERPQLGLLEILWHYYGNECVFV